MEPNKILSASILDLVFDDRNKEYGAYYLRATYPQRIKKSLLVTAIIAGLVFGGTLWANSFKPKKTALSFIPERVFTEIPPEEKIVEPPPPPEQPEPEQTRTEIYTPPIIVPNDQVDQPPPTTEDLRIADISDEQRDGIDPTGILGDKPIDDGNTGIIEQKTPAEFDGIRDFVHVPAKYDGDWVKFLTRNLRAEVAVDNGAPVGEYKVVIQFVVDKQGNVSSIKALTNHGYGMEEEAIRVLRKAKGWKPGIWEGREVNSYHQQPIKFVVEEN